MLRTIIGIVFLIAAALRAETVQFDPAGTKVQFTLPSMLHTVHGRFQLKEGAIQFDPVSGQASGRVTIDCTSGKSGNNDRDKRMHDSILESAKYPEITFTPDHIEGKFNGDGESQVQVHGMFAIHGAEHEMVLPFQLRASGGEISARTRFAVPYVRWGMKNPSTLFLRVKDTVEIEIDAAGRLSQSAVR